MTTYRINGIAQIGFVVADADAAMHQYSRLLGITEWNINTIDTENGRGRIYSDEEGDAVKARIAWAVIGGVEIELIEPQDTTSIYARFLEDRGPGVHHIMFHTDDYDRTVQSLTNRGITRIVSGGLQGTQFQLFDTQDALGVLSEFATGEALVPDATE